MMIPLYERAVTVAALRADWKRGIIVDEGGKSKDESAVEAAAASVQ
ncbi:hypothetical protein [Aromatoleum aromaticum]|nr:hypothetical protein [Aromatoleum aromaticum]